MGGTLFGWMRLRLTSAACTARLREISREIPLDNIQPDGPLSVCFTVERRHAGKIRLRDGESLVEIADGGMPRLLRFISRWRIVAAMVLALLILTVYLPTRILFIRVEGNGDLPSRQILEASEDCGLYFGSSRRALRSEQLKNHLLYAIPELRWAGVNTQGCKAVITVALRDSGASSDPDLPGDIVAVTDAMVTEIQTHCGTAVISPGQAVRSGQVLISGSSDLLTTVSHDRAEGEVYGITRRKIQTRLPDYCLQRVGFEGQTREFSLLIGKKRVNFLNHSGILHSTCVKMRKIEYLKLPGGFTLPVALITETYTPCRTKAAERPEAQPALLEAARHAVRQQMLAGAILGEACVPDGNVLQAVFDCREMIGVFRPEIETEGDTNDRENGERGAG